MHIYINNMEPQKKQKIFRVLNGIAFLIILFLLFNYREKFYAMIHPRGEELVQHSSPELAEGQWLNSPPLKLSELKGKVVVLDFWTFNCINCRHVLPTLNEWVQRYGSDSVIFIGVHTPETDEEGDLTSLKKFVEKWKVTYPILIDNNYRTWNRFSVQFWPSTFLIDKKGMIRELHIGELGYPALEKKLDKLIHE